MIVAVLPLMWIAVCADLHAGGLARLVSGLRSRARQARVLGVALVVVAVVVGWSRSSTSAYVVFVAAYSVMLGWLVAHAGVIEGAGIVASGVASNFVVMLVNRGMPVFTTRAEAGSATVLHHAALRSSTALWWLGDTLHVPGRLFGGWYSIGDLLVLAGVGVVVWCGSRATKGAPVTP